MFLFLIFYFSVYGLLHYYALRKVKSSLNLGKKRTRLLGLFMLLMILAPVLVRVVERAGITGGLHQLAYIAFSWMGLLFIFVSVSVTFDLIRLFRFLFIKLFNTKSTRQPMASAPFFYLSLLLTLVFYGYGLFEAAGLKEEHVVVRSSKIPAEVERIRIVQISDLHLGLFIRERQVEKILERVAAAEPDLLVSTGDLVDGQPNDLRQEAKLLSSCKPPLGKIAVTGNHEFYAGLEHSLNFTVAAGFTILRQQAKRFSHLTVAGVDDQAVTSFHQSSNIAEAAFLASLPEKKFTLLLKHRPEVNPDSIGLFDLQLSGHTHKGQIFPFNLITWIFYPYPAGQLTKLSRGSLYLSRGTGTWGPPIRIFAPPEITIIDLVHES